MIRAKKTQCLNKSCLVLRQFAYFTEFEIVERHFLGKMVPCENDKKVEISHIIHFFLYHLHAARNATLYIISQDNNTTSATVFNGLSSTSHFHNL